VIGQVHGAHAATAQLSLDLATRGELEPRQLYRRRVAPLSREGAAKPARLGRRRIRLFLVFYHHGAQPTKSNATRPEPEAKRRCLVMGRSGSNPASPLRAAEIWGNVGRCYGSR